MCLRLSGAFPPYSCVYRRGVVTGGRLRILTIFRPKRIKDGKPHVSRSYRGRYRLDEGDKLTDVPLHTTDKRVARERLEGIVREKQLEAVGVLSPHRAALQTTPERHLSDYLADLQAVGRDDQYIFDLNTGCVDS